MRITSRFLSSRSAQESGAASPVLPFQLPSQMASPVERTRLNSGNAETKPPSDFRTRESLQFAKKNHGSQAFPEMRNRLKDSGAAFRFDEGLFGRRPFIRGIADESRSGVIVVFLERCVGSPLAKEHQGFIDSYAGYPGRKSRVFAKSSEVG